ncbi:hypothetical protein Dde_2853 [Oleidesulfovibrio alaskensis G20]|jgi:hypothetical protein|uniref:Uncharacterized protein n=1 Tax=Oleidesulfovibrio alaskensis (strain ATCC BAA-1058 / DSM 17464 / G20) TaxID=207559 RepID=Q30XE8_OLEA2|nr:hypothetical protein [Oleidesulfovibrio alaskensis]ABB39648.1 hypothetical protein Dde_2853 [Oleidesulfovibrio alaskensis G20]MBG0773984.1 hypothetical protein [Oleidesulfovibrio alaskensis]
MASMIVLEDSPAVLRIGPGAEHRVSVAVVALLGTGMMGGAVLAAGDPALTAVCIIGGVVLGLVALMLHNQSRQLEWNLDERMVYVLGRQASDMYAVPFADIACLRLTKRRVARSLAGASITSQPPGGRRGRERYYLEMAMRDTGYEGIDQSFNESELRGLCTVLCRRTGLALCDETDGTRNRPAAGDAVSSVVLPPREPSPASVLRRTAQGVEWPLSPGWPAVGVMFMVLASLMAGAGSAYTHVAAGGDASPALMIMALGISFFFMVIVLARLAHAFTGRGRITVRGGVLVRELLSPLGNRSLEVSLREVVALRVIAPRTAVCQLQVLGRTGQAAVLASVSSGVTPLTVGDLYWLRGTLNRMLDLQRAAEHEEHRRKQVMEQDSSGPLQ